MPTGRLGGRPDLRRDGRPGRSTTGWVWPRRPSSRPRATWPATSVRTAIRVNLVAAGPLLTHGGQVDPGLRRVRGRLDDEGAAGLGRHRLRAGRAGLRRAAVGLVPAHHGGDRARRRWRARHGRVTGPGWRTVDARRPSLVELRVLEGANLYFPRAAVKLTLDMTTLLDLPDAEAPRGRGVSSVCRAARPGLAGHRAAAAVRDARRGEPGTPGGPRVRHHPAGGAQPPDRRPAPHGGRLPVAAPRPRRRHWATRSRECWTRCPATDVDASRARRPPSTSNVSGLGRTAEHPSSARAGGRGHRHQRQDHHLPDGGADGSVRRPGRRLVVHRRRVHRRRAGRARRLLRAERSRPRARRPAGAARGDRDGPGRHPAARPRRGPQRRLGRDERQRRPPRHAGRRHASTSWPRSRRSSPG